MMTDDKLYRSLNQAVNNMNEATLSLNRLVDDIQKNPKVHQSQGVLSPSGMLVRGTHASPRWAFASP
jgi:hypothetical protein